MGGREEQLNNYFVDYTRYLHFNEHWIVMQFGRGDNPDPFPVVQMACVPQHHILKDEDADLEGTCDVYDMKALHVCRKCNDEERPLARERTSDRLSTRNASR